MQKKREKSVKARGGIEWGSATAANQARKFADREVGESKKLGA